MPILKDFDPFFSGRQHASRPYNTVGVGEVRRLLNARFQNGTITNSFEAREIKPEFCLGNNTRIYASPVTWRAFRAWRFNAWSYFRELCRRVFDMYYFR